MYEHDTNAYQQPYGVAYAVSNAKSYPDTDATAYWRVHVEPLPRYFGPVERRDRMAGDRPLPR